MIIKRIEEKSELSSVVTEEQYKNLVMSIENLGDKIETVCNRHFYSRFEFLGNVDYDERVLDAILKKKLFVREYPDTGTAVRLKKIAEQLIEGSQNR